MMSESPKAAYVRDGFYIYDAAVWPSDAVDRAVEGMDAVRRGEYDTGVPPRPSAWSPGDDPQRLCKIEKPQIANRAIMDLIKHPALGALATEVCGAEWVQVWWVQLLYKPPVAGADSSGTHVGWHQDRNYWGAWEEGSELFTAWIALSEVGPEDGPMHFVRGSHQWGLLPGSDFYGQDLAGQKRALSTLASDEWVEVAATLPKGGVSFHHCLTLHGSGPNHAAGPRRSLAVHMRTERSRPVDDKREGLTAFIDDPTHCPVVFNRNS